jgi:hypothetical protein
MSKRLLLAAAALAALWTGPAGAFSLCPDNKTGEYTPDACDLIWPFEPDPDRIECDLVADVLAEQSHPVCLDAYLRRGWIDEPSTKRWRVRT